MRVTLKTRGGYLAASPKMRGLVHEVDSETLGVGAQAELRRLVESAKTAESMQGSESAVEAESHLITVDSDGESLTLRQTDDAMSPEFRNLAKWIKDHSRKD